jgi:hypothetical protein
MRVKAKVTSYHTNKFCCKRHKSLIEVTYVECKLGESFSAQCMDCGNTIEGARNVNNLLVTDNRLLTPYLLNKANLN